jgi:hypothetical protein
MVMISTEAFSCIVERTSKYRRLADGEGMSLGKRMQQLSRHRRKVSNKTVNRFLYETSFFL